MVRASVYADSAANALLGINASNVILNRYCVLRASRGTVTVAKARVFAFLVAVIKKVCRNAVLFAAIVVFSLLL